MYILSYTTANFHYSAAILYSHDDNKIDVIAYGELHNEQNNIANFVPFINDLLCQSRVCYQDIKYVTLATGPGSFTGIRTGLAYAHGLRLSTNIPVLGINSFEIMAATVVHDNIYRSDILVVLESRRRDKYVQLYDSNLTILKPAAALIPEEYRAYVSQNTLITGGGQTMVTDIISPVRFTAIQTFNAKDVGTYACQMIRAGNARYYPLVPYYLHSLQNFQTIGASLDTHMA